MLGVVTDMPYLMAASDLIIAPFLSTEGPSDYFISVLEAMAVGRPTIVSNVGGMPELIKNEIGYLVDPLDVDQISNYIHFLLADSNKRKSVGDAASNFVSKKFDPVIISQRYYEVYLEVLDENAN